MEKKIIVISAVSFFEGGPLSVLKDCLDELNRNFNDEYKVLALTFINLSELYPNIHFVNFKQARKSYFHRFYLEYYYFKKIAKKFDPHLWISLHDVTPNVGSTPQVVYCHNPSPFYRLSWKEFRFAPKFVLFNFFYKYFYRINIHRNDYVIVQQNWLRNAFHRQFSIPEKRIIVAKPETPFKKNDPESDGDTSSNNVFCFFYPTFPRIFKNIELIGEAIKLLYKQDLGRDYKVIVTISGEENAYARWVCNKYKDQHLSFCGKLSREQVFEYYKQCDALLFPSKLETWGLPLSEYRFTKKPIIASNLPYAKEAVGEYSKVAFFNPTDAQNLALIMRQTINNTIAFEHNKKIEYSAPYTQSWNELLNLVLK